jgi:hypothetical protein
VIGGGQTAPVLIRQATLQRIAAGEVDTQFRRWRRPTVKAGGTLRTAIGMLDILAVDVVDEAAITDADARRAGDADAAAVVAGLADRPDALVYRVRLRLGGADPRIELRDDDDLSADDVAAVIARLAALDRHRVDRQGGVPWTTETLTTIRDQPHVRAPDLAARLGRDTPSFKADVRKLKALGLTISHSPGYELSPRGRVILSALER